MDCAHLGLSGQPSDGQAVHAIGDRFDNFPALALTKSVFCARNPVEPSVLPAGCLRSIEIGTVNASAVRGGTFADFSQNAEISRSLPYAAGTAPETWPNQGKSARREFGSVQGRQCVE